jgi:hypothetical protein
MDTKRVVVLFILWIVIVNFFAVLALNRFNLKGDTAYTWIDPNQFSQNQQWNLISLHARWDSFWYLDIAQNGYIFNGAGKLSNIVFFPLYPLLIKATSILFGGNLIFAGWILSTIFLLLALIYFSKLIKEFHGGISSQLPLLFLLIFPTAFFSTQFIQNLYFYFFQSQLFIMP